MLAVGRLLLGRPGRRMRSSRGGRLFTHGLRPAFDGATPPYDFAACPLTTGSKRTRTRSYQRQRPVNFRLQAVVLHVASAHHDAEVAKEADIAIITCCSCAD